MRDDDFEATCLRLAATLDDLIGLLRSSGESHWADWVAADRAAIAQGDRNALDHFLSAFGGMGSLNDIFLRMHDGRVLDNNEQRARNERFGRVKESAWQDARAIVRVLDSN